MPAARTGRSVRVARDAMSEAERALAESIERYRSLFAYVPHAAFSLDLDGTFTDANQVAQTVSGFALEELRAMRFTDLLAGEDVDPAIEAFAGALNRAPQELEMTMLHKDGHRLELNVVAVPVVVYDEVVGVHGLAENITERNEMRRELERTRAAAEQANAAKSLFLANMSHEVRTPLTSVLGATEILAEAELEAHDRSLVELIHRSGERLLRLVNDILDVSRLEAGKLDVHHSAINLHAVVDDVVEWAGPLARHEGLGLYARVDADLPGGLVGDGMRVSQVLTNLVGNALKFTEQGEVALSVEVLGRGDPARVCFTVRDTGIGIPADELARLFEPFSQADTSTTRKYGGAGLGLAITQQLVALMGGRIEADSTPGVGTVFTVTLPFRRAGQDD